MIILHLCVLLDMTAEYKIFLGSSLCPCLVSLACLMGNYTLWKPLNHAVLMCTRDPRSTVRLGALSVVHALFRGLKEQFLVLLPETIPFIAELMEDEDVLVEKECQQVIKTIEKLSGESLDDYLH